MTAAELIGSDEEISKLQSHPEHVKWVHRIMELKELHIITGSLRLHKTGLKAMMQFDFNFAA